MSQLFRNLLAARVFTNQRVISSKLGTGLSLQFLKPVLSANPVNNFRFYVKNSSSSESDFREALSMKTDFSAPSTYGSKSRFSRSDDEGSSTGSKSYRDGFKKFNNSFDRGSKTPRNTRQISDPSMLEGDSPMESAGVESSYLSNTSGADFANFDIPQVLLDRLKTLGYTKPFEIQNETLKHTLAGKDLVGRAFTGSGKTLAFAIPIISKIYTRF